MPKRNLQGRRALVSGATSGIGWHLALQLAQAGVAILATGRRADRLTELQRLIVASGGSCQTVAGDLAEEATRRELMELVEKSWSELDLLINCAGVGAMGPFETTAPETIQAIFDVNFFAAIELTRDALPSMRKGKEPMVVNVASVLGHVGVPLKSIYCASKHAMIGWSEAIRGELARDGIDVLVVCPSTTRTEFFEHALEDREPRAWLGRGAMLPEEVARQTVSAIQSGRKEIILSMGGWWLVHAARWFPNLTRRWIARTR